MKVSLFNIFPEQNVPLKCHVPDQLHMSMICIFTGQQDLYGMLVLCLMRNSASKLCHS